MVFKHFAVENVVPALSGRITPPLTNCLQAKNEAAQRKFAAPQVKLDQELMTVVIAIIPIAVVVPAMAVFIPPAMPLSPAAFARFVQVMTGTVRLPAVPTMVLDGLVEFMIRFGDASRAAVIVTIMGECAWRPRECQHPSQRRRCQSHSYEKPLPSRLKRHVIYILSLLPRLGWGSGPKV